MSDRRIALKDWGGEDGIKAKGELTPSGQLPVLEVDGVKYTQSRAILRFVAQRGGLYPTDDVAAMLCDSYCGMVEDTVDAVKKAGINAMALLFGKPLPEEVREAMTQAVQSDGVITKELAKWDRELEGKGYLVGGRMSLADLYVFFYFNTRFVLGYGAKTYDTAYQKATNVIKWMDWMRTHDKIQAYLHQMPGNAIGM